MTTKQQRLLGMALSLKREKGNTDSDKASELAKSLAAKKLTGLPEKAAAFLMKKAWRDPVVMAASVLGMGLQAGIQAMAQQGSRARGKADRIDQEELLGWARKYLKTDKVYAAPVKGLRNASYSTQQVGKNKWHVIRYDPTMTKAVGAHEIGHGMSSVPRVPFSGTIAPFLANMGAYSIGQSGGEEGLLPLVAGLGMQLPTLADEWLASRNAKKLLKAEGADARGLTRNWMTYAAPLASTGLLGLAGYVNR